jgi:hypothetical protein
MSITPQIPQIEMTEEQIARSVSAAFDSVNLINDLKSQTSLTEEEQDRLDRNKQHLTIMLAKDWFSGALTEQQTTDINACLV